MNKIIKNISMLVLVAFTVAACGGGGGGAGVAIQPSSSDAPSTQEQVNNTPEVGTWSAWTLTSTSGGDITTNIDEYGEYVDQPYTVPASTFAYGQWYVPGNDGSSKTATEQRTVTETVPQYTVNITRTNVVTTNISAITKNFSRTCSTDNCNGSSTKQEITPASSSSGDVVQNSTRIQPSIILPFVWEYNSGVSNPYYNDPVDTAFWGNWTETSRSGLTESYVKVNFGEWIVQDEYSTPAPTITYTWDPIVNGSATEQYVTQTGTKSSVIPAHQQQQERSYDLETHRASGTISYSRVCKVAVYGDVDSPAPVCVADINGHTDTRTDNLNSTVIYTELDAGDEVRYVDIPATTPVNTAVTNQVDNPAYVSTVWDGNGNPENGDGIPAGPNTASSSFDIVTGSNGSDDFYISNTGTGTASTDTTLLNNSSWTPVNSGFAGGVASLEGSYLPDNFGNNTGPATKFLNDLIIHGHQNGWDGTGFDIKTRSGKVNVTSFAPGASIEYHASTVYDYNKYTCVVRDGGVCSHENGITIQADSNVATDADLNNLTVLTTSASINEAINNDLVGASVAVIWHKFDTLTDEQIESLVMDTAQDIAGSSLKRLDLSKALSPVGNLN